MFLSRSTKMHYHNCCRCRTMYKAFLHIFFDSSPCLSLFLCISLCLKFLFPFLLSCPLSFPTPSDYFPFISLSLPLPVSSPTHSLALPPHLSYPSPFPPSFLPPLSLPSSLLSSLSGFLISPSPSSSLDLSVWCLPPRSNPGHSSERD